MEFRNEITFYRKQKLPWLKIAHLCKKDAFFRNERFMLDVHDLAKCFKFAIFLVKARKKYKSLWFEFRGKTIKILRVIEHNRNLWSRKWKIEGKTSNIFIWQISKHQIISFYQLIKHKSFVSEEWVFKSKYMRRLGSSSPILHWPVSARMHTNFQSSRKIAKLIYTSWVK